MNARVSLGPFELDREQRLLFRDGEMIPLPPKSFDTLDALADNPGRLVTKAELIERVWPDTFVEENNLNQNISILRKALAGGLAIETVARRGYRLVLPREASSHPLTARVGTPEIAPARLRGETLVRASDDEAVGELSAQLSKDAKRETGGDVSARSAEPKHRLRKPVAAVMLVCLVLAAVGAAVWVYRFISAPQENSLVILPFTSLTHGPDDEYLADGLTEEVTANVARIEGLRVVARTTAFQFKGKSIDVRRIGRELGVGAVLEGSVRREGETVRITAQLNKTGDGYHLWAQTYEADSVSMFQVQRRLAQEIAGALGRRLNFSTLPMADTENREARNLYLKGLHFLNTTDSEKAIRYFQEAAALDPSYAAPWAGQAEGYAMLGWSGAMPTQECSRLGHAAADRALSLDSNSSAAHTSKAIIFLVLNWDWPEAEKEFRRSIALNASDAEAHHWYSHYLTVMNETESSLEQSQLALDLDPLNLLVSSHLGWHYLRAREYSKSIRASQATLELDPRNGNALYQIGEAYEHLNEPEQALDAYGKLDFLPPRTVQQIKDLTVALRRGGNPGYFAEEVNQFLSNTPSDDYAVARSMARVGRANESLDYLERALAKRNPSIIYLRTEKYFDPLHNDLRWKRILSALKLNPS